MREKIELKPGVIRTQIDRTQSKPIEGRDGATEYMRICDDDERILFCPAGLEAAIAESGAQAGDIIEIAQKGKGKSATWSVGIVSATKPHTLTRPNGPALHQHAALGITEADAQPARPTATRQVSTDTTDMAAAYMAAIEATTAAEQYATHAGLELNLTTADTITRVALSIYIQQTRSGK
jgi:hypothetical protein